jgi:hypothetical protein
MAPLSEVFRARTRGAVAQMGERLVRNEEVRGSIPLGSTTPLPLLANRRVRNSTRSKRATEVFQAIFCPTTPNS